MIFQKLKASIFCILCVLLFSGSFKNLVLAQENKVAKIVDEFESSIAHFEERFYRSETISQAELDSHYQNLQQSATSYFIRTKQDSNPKYLRMAYAELSKMKNMKVLTLFLDGISDEAHRNRKFELLRKNHELIGRLNKLKDNVTLSDGREGNDEHNQIRRSINALHDSVRTHFPDIFYLLLLQQPVNIRYLQKQCLNIDEALLDYWLDGDQLYLFLVQPDTFLVRQWTVSSEELKENMTQLLAPFFEVHDLLDLKFDVHLAHQLYRDLFEPVKQLIHGAKKLIIIPDEQFILFPFEILVTDTTIEKRNNKNILYHNFSNYPYLVNRFAISYNYTVAALYPEASTTGSRKGLGRRLLTMRDPAISDDEMQMLTQIGISQSDLEVSDYSGDEIKRVSRLLWRHDNLKGDEVTKAYFCDHGKNYRWLYLAQPAILNSENYLESGILFASEDSASSLQSNWLFLEEVAQCSLRADMLTLSSCKLISPFSVESKGKMALPQAFLTAGIKSVVHDSWKINSISTSQFMSKFYWELKFKRQTNSEALREAKLASMKDTFEYQGTEISRAHPYFWGTFRLIGNPMVRPPSGKTIHPKGVVVFVYVMVIIIALFITRKTLTNRKSDN